MIFLAQKQYILNKDSDKQCHLHGLARDPPAAGDDDALNILFLLQVLILRVEICSAGSRDDFEQLYRRIEAGCILDQN